MFKKNTTFPETAALPKRLAPVAQCLIGAVLLGLFLVGPLAAGAQQHVIRARIEQHFLDMNLGAAKQQLQYEDNNTFKALYRHHAAFLRAVAWQSASAYEHFGQVSEQQLALLDRQPRSPYRAAFRAECYLERSVIEGLQQNRLQAANQLRQCKGALEHQQRKYPDLPFNYRIQGGLQIAFSALPAKYKWAAEIFGFEGNLRKGLEHLKFAARKSEILAHESQLLLYFVERNMLADPWLAHQRIDSLRKAHPDKLLINFYYVHNALDRQDNATALSAAETVLNNKGGQAFQAFPQFNYLYGRALIYDGQYREGADYLARFVKQFKGDAFQADARFKRAMALALAGERVAARQALQQTQQAPTSAFEEDRYAKKRANYFLQHGFRPLDLQLMEARLAFDGGYYARAKRLLFALQKEHNNLSATVKAQLYYRLGRIYHRSAKPVQAKTYYGMCIKQPSEQERWVRVYANYYIGKVFEDEQDWHKARYYYRQALKYKDFSYEAGLEHKAKAGLERLAHKRYQLGGRSEASN